MEDNIRTQMKDKCAELEFYSLAMGESTEISDISQLLVFVRGIDSSFNITQELAAMQSLHVTTKGENLIGELKSVMDKYKLDFKNLSCVTIDGGRNMSGNKIGLVG